MNTSITESDVAAAIGTPEFGAVAARFVAQFFGAGNHIVKKSANIGYGLDFHVHAPTRPFSLRLSASQSSPTGPIHTWSIRAGGFYESAPELNQAVRMVKERIDDELCALKAVRGVFKND